MKCVKLWCGAICGGAMLINDVANIWRYLNLAWSTWNVALRGTSNGNVKCCWVQCERWCDAHCGWYGGIVCCERCCVI